MLVGASCHFNPLVALFVNVRNFGNPEEADRRNLVMKFLTKIPSTRAIFSVQKLLVLRFDKNCCGILVTDSLTKF